MSYAQNGAQNGVGLTLSRFAKIPSLSPSHLNDSGFGKFSGSDLYLQHEAVPISTSSNNSESRTRSEPVTGGGRSVRGRRQNGSRERSYTGSSSISLCTPILILHDREFRHVRSDRLLGMIKIGDAGQRVWVFLPQHSLPRLYHLHR
jgi:hypothetical protein